MTERELRGLIAAVKVGEVSRRPLLRGMAAVGLSAPFTADDVVFNWEYAADPATAATTIGSYKDIKVEKVDTHTVRIRFPKPTPFWADAFVGQRGMIVPKHLFENYKGGASRDAPANLKPVGTGPYKFVDFTPGDPVTGERNPNYHLPNAPYFDTLAP